MNKNTTALIAAIFLVGFMLASFEIRAADAPTPSVNPPAAIQPTPTLASVAAERDAIKKENGELKAQIDVLTVQLAQYKAAAEQLQKQRDDILSAQVNAAVIKVTPQPKQP